VSKVTDWIAEQIAKLDAEGLGRTGVALLLMTPDLGHAGKLFAVREAADRGIIGYLMAFGVDVTFWFAFREAGKVKRLTRRGFAVFVALLACSINGAFNVAYYRDNAAADPFWVSLVLGASAPTLAALLSVMQAFRQVEQAERAEAKEDKQAERTFELERLRIQAEADARVAVEAERTKQIRAQARAEQTRVKAEAAKEEAEQRQHQDELDKVLAELGKSGDILAPFLDNPALTQAEVAQMLGLSRQTVGYHLGRLEEAGVIKRNGHGVEVLIEKQEEET